MRLSMKRLIAFVVPAVVLFAVTDALALIGEELLGTPDVQRVSRLIVDSVWRLFPTRAVALRVLDDRTQELRQLVAAGQPEALQEAPSPVAKMCYHKSSSLQWKPCWM